MKTRPRIGATKKIGRNPGGKATRKSLGLLLTCEHAANKIPKAYQAAFAPHKALLASHRGWDIGAYLCYQLLCRQLPNSITTEKQSAKYSRLLVELNRSAHHPALLSDITKSLPKNQQLDIIKRFYHPYREEVRQKLVKLLKSHRRVLHLGIHSFTPVLNHTVRQTDIGLLYDPKNAFERAFSFKLKHLLNQIAPEYRVRMNYPYKGTSDGLTTSLRNSYAHNRYAGIEIELNQKHLLHAAKKNPLLLAVVQAVSEALQS